MSGLAEKRKSTYENLQPLVENFAQALSFEKIPFAEKTLEDLGHLFDSSQGLDSTLENLQALYCQILLELETLTEEEKNRFLGTPLKFFTEAQLPEEESSPPLESSISQMEISNPYQRLLQWMDSQTSFPLRGEELKIFIIQQKCFQLDFLLRNSFSSMAQDWLKNHYAQIKTLYENRGGRATLTPAWNDYFEKELGTNLLKNSFKTWVENSLAWLAQNPVDDWKPYFHEWAFLFLLHPEADFPDGSLAFSLGFFSLAEAKEIAMGLIRLQKLFSQILQPSPQMQNLDSIEVLVDLLWDKLSGARK